MGVVRAHCPAHCECDDHLLLVNCTSWPRTSDLEPLSVIPISLNPMLETLHLQRNALKAIDVSALQFYRQLVFADFSRNDISGPLPRRCFRAQRRLRDLRLDFNKVTNVSKETFEGLGDLRSLSLSHNRLTKLEKGVFQHLVKVRRVLNYTQLFLLLNPYFILKVYSY